jgi:hypothetical protein
MLLFFGIGKITALNKLPWIELLHMFLTFEVAHWPSCWLED